MKYEIMVIGYKQTEETKRKIGLANMSNNGLLRGLVRISCVACGLRQTGMVGHVQTDKCPSCGDKGLNVTVGNKAPRRREDFESLNKFKKEVINMVDIEKVKKVADLMVELKKLGVNVEMADEEKEDDTKGSVGEEPEESEKESATVFERAQTGKGFEIYADYNTLDSNKYKRLTRD